jgi:hypothetical protein
MGGKEQTLIYLCKNYACLRPVSNVAELGLFAEKNVLGSL